MAMTRQNWTLNALSIELCQDRRALGRKLSTLTPDEERTIGGKVTKRWKLSRVLKHLGAQGNGKDADRQTAAMLAEYERIAELLTRHLFPALASGRFFLGVFPRHLHHDLGITKAQALRCYSSMCVMLAYQIADFLSECEAEIKGEPLTEGLPADTMFEYPPCLQELARLGPEKYAAKHWPDKAA